MTDVEGGLEEPAELDAEKGTLRLASPDDQHDAAAWEAATAAVLRKARRLGEDDPDSAAWDALTRTTLDGIPVAPIGTRDSVADLATSGRPTRAGDWDMVPRISPAASPGTRVAGLHTVSHLSPDFFSSAEAVYFHSPEPIFQL